MSAPRTGSTKLASLGDLKQPTTVSITDLFDCEIVNQHALPTMSPFSTLHFGGEHTPALKGRCRIECAGGHPLFDEHDQATASLPISLGSCALWPSYLLSLACRGAGFWKSGAAKARQLFIGRGRVPCEASSAAAPDTIRASRLSSSGRCRHAISSSCLEHMRRSHHGGDAWRYGRPGPHRSSTPKLFRGILTTTCSGGRATGIYGDKIVAQRLRGGFAPAPCVSKTSLALAEPNAGFPISFRERRGARSPYYRIAAR